MKKINLTKPQRQFHKDYYFGIGIGLLVTAVAKALGDLWWVTMFWGFVFIVIAALGGRKK
ncbi:MAG: hypothetical protein AABX23_00245 [Nanoarchaeota archaeon]